MGVPKFFRYISERYPCLSEFIKEYQIPEFDNLYLDMNGIIHNCSHPDDANPHFRISEEKIFADIFHYIEVLFQMIKPRKVFFMAVDGVAPRAKMNQQRGRRFRSAKDALKLESEAIKRGEKLPEESRFDSNCITPGTEFMTRLHEQLKYMVVKKISEDPLWQRCEVILSGHETPGEGEHKIMDYIRYKRSQPGYDPNTRHCLYGLDADLIMLGLCTHDPHFSLLREEVKFGRKATQRICVPEEVRFCLLHLSLMREYLEMEFEPLKKSLKNFKFDIENIIDDWVLMGFLVGNDFIPSLPNLYIANGALPVLYKAYIDILPQLDGYINENGILNLHRFETFMKKLGEIDVQNFEEVREDLLYMEAKTGRKIEPFRKNHTKQKSLEYWKADKEEESLGQQCLESLEFEKCHRDSGLGALIAATEKNYSDLEDPISDDGDDDEEFENYKRNYYINKLEYLRITPEVMRSQAEGYVRAIQWNLHYYYNGVCSWSWYYPHHYAPYISDIKNFQNLKLDFEIGKPFMPYEQLLAVLPVGSKELLPKCYQDLMTNESSPIKKYYPEDFETDLNGKRQEWEAVVLVPFIDEDVLLEAMQSCMSELSSSEKKRNNHGPMLCYSYTEENLGVYEAPMYFPNINVNHAKFRTVDYNELTVTIDKLVKGAYPGANLDVYFPGFPTFKHLQYQGHLTKSKVKVFEQPSRGESMIVQVIPSDRVLDAKIPMQLLNKIVYVAWPHLVEAQVIALCNSKQQVTYVGEGKQPMVEPSSSTFKHEVENITEHYTNRLGIEFGKVIVLVKVKTLKGQKYMFTTDGRVSLEKIYSENPSNYPLQIIVEDIQMHNEFGQFFKTVDDIFPVGSTCIVLTANEYYGAQGIIKSDEKKPEGRVCVEVTIMDEPNLSKAKFLSDNILCRYMTSYVAASQLGMPSQMFARITGGFFVTHKNKEGGLKTINFGLNLKLNKKNMETPGYTKKIDNTWYYTEAAVDAVKLYDNVFPEIFDYLANNNHSDDILVTNIFGSDSDEKCQAVLTWLKSQPYSSVERRTCNTEILDAQVIKEIEELVDAYATDNCKKEIVYCAPNSLYKPEICFGNLSPDESVLVQLFDRIVNIRSNHTVPFGLKGTIIGIPEPTSKCSNDLMYDIVFDKQFEGGIEINCSIGRGYRLSSNTFINISHGRRKYLPQLGKCGENKAFLRQVPKENYEISQKNKHRNTASSNSAFAKFQHSNVLFYNAVPPLMPNGDLIYKNCNQHKYSPYQQQKSQYKDRSIPEQMNHRNPSTKQYVSDFQGSFNNYVKDDGNNGQYKHDTYKNNKYKIFYSEQQWRHGNNINKNSVEKTGNDFDSMKRNYHKSTTSFPSSVHSSINDFTIEPKKTLVDETADTLKKLLKISTSIDNQFIKTETTLKTAVQEKNKECANQPFSVQLLSYYQTKGLGLPRYQYITSNEGIQAQIKLPNRQIIIGRPTKDKEDASESVAERVLKTLNCIEEQNKNTQNPQTIPIPPKQWWKQDDGKVTSHDNGSKTRQKSKASNSGCWKEFIPLQAVIKDKANCSIPSNQTVGNINEDNGIKNTRAILTEKPDNTPKQTMQSTQKKEPKHKKSQRKMRIAANFTLQS